MGKTASTMSIDNIDVTDPKTGKLILPREAWITSTNLEEIGDLSSYPIAILFDLPNS